jgi:hypothetical protein
MAGCPLVTPGVDPHVRGTIVTIPLPRTALLPFVSLPGDLSRMQNPGWSSEKTLEKIRLKYY